MTRGQVGGLLGVVGTLIGATFGVASFVLKLSDVGYEKQQREESITKAVNSYLDNHPEKIVNQ